MYNKIIKYIQMSKNKNILEKILFKYVNNKNKGIIFLCIIFKFLLNKIKVCYLIIIFMLEK